MNTLQRIPAAVREWIYTVAVVVLVGLFVAGVITDIEAIDRASQLSTLLGAFGGVLARANVSRPQSP